MLWLIFIILLILWLAGVVAGYTLGGYIHFLLALAVVVLITRVIDRPGENRGCEETENVVQNKDEKDRPDDERAA